MGGSVVRNENTSNARQTQVVMGASEKVEVKTLSAGKGIVTGERAVKTGRFASAKAWIVVLTFCVFITIAVAVALTTMHPASFSAVDFKASATSVLKELLVPVMVLACVSTSFVLAIALLVRRQAKKTE